MRPPYRALMPGTSFLYSFQSACVIRLIAENCSGMIHRTLQLDELQVGQVEIKAKVCGSGCIAMRKQASNILICVGYVADTIMPSAIFRHLENPEVQMEITGDRFAQSNLGIRIDGAAVRRNEYGIRVDMPYGRLACQDGTVREHQEWIWNQIRYQAHATTPKRVRRAASYPR